MMEYLAVLLGGGLGATLRVWLEANTVPVGFLPPTLWVNLGGALVMSVFTTIGLDYGLMSARARLFWTTGLMGGFTTFGSFCLDSFSLLQHGLWLDALVYFTCTVLGAIVLFYLGSSGTRAILRRLGQEPT